MKKKRIEVDIDKLVGETYFKIAKWHNNEDELDGDQLKNRLIGVSQQIIESVLNSVFHDKEKGDRFENTKVVDDGLLSGINIDFDSIKKGQ